MRGYETLSGGPPRVGRVTRRPPVPEWRRVGLQKLGQPPGHGIARSSCAQPPHVITNFDCSTVGSANSAESSVPARYRAGTAMG